MRGRQALAIARRWIGTPYLHQASAQGAGTDCLGLLRGVWREMYGSEPEVVPAYTPDWSEVTGEERLWRAARTHLVPSEIGPGAVLLFRMRNGAVAKHLGIAGEQQTFVHAYARHGVVESPLSDPWRRRIVGCFQFPEGTS